jgi:hypothetical protein
MPTDRPLNSEERMKLTNFIQLAMKRLGADRVTSPHPDKLLTLVSQAIDLHRRQDEADRHAGLFDATVSLGTLWGQIICDQVGWTWASIKTEGVSDVFGVVSPNRSHLIFPLHHINVLLLDPSREQNSLTLYNDLKARVLPPSKEHAYTVIGTLVTL